MHAAALRFTVTSALVVSVNWGAFSNAGGSISGVVTCVGRADCAGAAVFIPRIEGRRFTPGDAVMDQRRLTFMPHVLTVLAGTRVIFPNNDDVRHNVFSASAAKRFNLGMYAPGSARSVVFDRPGIIELLCNVHTEMSAYVIVSETPFATAVGRDGRYVVENVPDGQHVVVAWHPLLAEQRRVLTVRAGENAPADFVLTGRR